MNGGSCGRLLVSTTAFYRRRTSKQVGTTTHSRTRLVDLGRRIGTDATRKGKERDDLPVGLLREVRGMAPEVMDEVSKCGERVP